MKHPLRHVQSMGQTLGGGGGTVSESLALPEVSPANILISVTF